MMTLHHRNTSLGFLRACCRLDSNEGSTRQSALYFVSRNCEINVCKAHGALGVARNRLTF